MGLFSFFEKVSDTINNLMSETQSADTQQIKEIGCGEKYTNDDFPYPLLLEKCKNIYLKISNYEMHISGKSGIESLETVYSETNDVECLKLLEEAKHNLFVPPITVKDLISCGRDKYNLTQEDFFIALKEAFNIIANNKEFSPEFCFDYFKKEIESHYFYYPPRRIDFKETMNNLVAKEFADIIKNYSLNSQKVKCPYCDSFQNEEVKRSKKCQNCGKKMFVIKISESKVLVTEENYNKIKETQSDYLDKLDFCYMILSTGYSAEDLESYLNKGNVNRLNDFAWKTLSGKRNEYYEQCQIDMLSKINFDLAKVLIWEGKKQTSIAKIKEAILFICESLYADISPIAFHPKFTCHKVNGKNVNDNLSDTVLYNDSHPSFINKTYIDTLLDLKDNFTSEEFKLLIFESLEKCTHFYLAMTPQEVYDVLIDNLI